MKKYLVLLFSLLWISTSDAATYYAVGTGNWSGAATVWSTSSGGAPALTTPTTSDDVVFDLHSTGTVALAGSANAAHNMTMTAPGAGTITTPGTSLTIAGTMTLASGMTFTTSLPFVISFTSAGSEQITTAAYRLPSFTFNGVGGTWTLQDAYDPSGSGSGAIVTITNGSFNTNSFAVGATSGVNFSSNNSNTRALTLGTTTWTLLNGSGLEWDIGTPTGMTLSAASSTIVNPQTSSNMTFDGGGLTYGTFTTTALTSAAVTIKGANTFGALTISNNNGGQQQVASGFALAANQTVTGTLTANGHDATSGRNFIYSTVLGTARTISAATVNITNTDFRDITATGAGNWDLHTITGGAGNAGGNTGIIFNTPKTCYYKTAISGFWSSANWYTTSGGSTACIPNSPLPQDTALFDANSITAGSLTVHVDMPRLGTVNWTGVLNTPAWAMDINCEIYGTITMIAAMTRTNTGTCALLTRQLFTVNSGTPSSTLPSLIINNVQLLALPVATSGSYTYGD